MRPSAPRCENAAPYCTRSGQPMRCVSENAHEWVFECPACHQVNILTNPQYRAALRELVRRERRLQR